MFYGVEVTGHFPINVVREEPNKLWFHTPPELPVTSFLAGFIFYHTGPIWEGYWCDRKRDPYLSDPGRKPKGAGHVTRTLLREEERRRCLLTDGQQGNYTTHLILTDENRGLLVPGTTSMVYAPDRPSIPAEDEWALECPLDARPDWAVPYLDTMAERLSSQESAELLEAAVRNYKQGIQHALNEANEDFRRGCRFEGIPAHVFRGGTPEIWPWCWTLEMTSTYNVRSFAQRIFSAELARAVKETKHIDRYANRVEAIRAHLEAAFEPFLSFS